MVRVFIGVAVFLIPTAWCLVVAWKKWEGIGGISAPKWRGWFAFVGLLSASIAMVPNIVFLVRYGTYGLHGMTDPPDSIWATVNRLAVLFWLVVVVTALLGKSKARFPLAMWTLVSFATDYLLLHLLRD